MKTSPECVIICWTLPFRILEELVGRTGSFWPPAGGSKKNGSEENWLSKWVQAKSETSLTGMESNHNGHSGEALYWSKKKVTNKRTLRPSHPAKTISELRFIWLRMETPKQIL